MKCSSSGNVSLTTFTKFWRDLGPRAEDCYGETDRPSLSGRFDTVAGGGPEEQSSATFAFLCRPHSAPALITCCSGMHEDSVTTAAFSRTFGKKWTCKAESLIYDTRKIVA